MTRAKPPAFQFYAKDWIADTRELTAAARGVLIDLIALCWENGSIPATEDAIARAAGVTAKEAKEAWPQIAHKFTSDNAPPGRLVNSRLQSERLKLAEYHRGSQAGGQESAARMTPEQRKERAVKAAKERWERRGDANPPKHPLSIDQASECLANADIATATASATAYEKTVADAPAEEVGPVAKKPKPYTEPLGFTLAIAVSTIGEAATPQHFTATKIPSKYNPQLSALFRGRSLEDCVSLGKWLRVGGEGMHRVFDVPWLASSSAVPAMTRAIQHAAGELQAPVRAQASAAEAPRPSYLKPLARIGAP